MDIEKIRNQELQKIEKLKSDLEAMTHLKEYALAKNVANENPELYQNIFTEVEAIKQSIRYYEDRLERYLQNNNY